MMAMTVSKAPLSSLVEFARGLHGPSWLMARRQRALQAFEKKGVPSTHDEEWRFTDLSTLAKVPYVPLSAAIGVGPSALQAVPTFAGSRLVFTPGLHQPVLDGAAPPTGVRFVSLAKLLRDGDARLEAAWTKTKDTAQNPFSSLNEALAVDGAFIDIAPGTMVKDPLHIVHLSPLGLPTPTSGHPRHIIRVGERAQVTIVETFATLGEGPHFANPVTVLDAEAGSQVEHLKINLESSESHHIGALDITLGRDAHVTDHSFVFGGGLVRNDIDVRFAGPGGEVTLNGLYLEQGTQHVDHHTSVDHAVPHCTSNEFYKGILDDKSRGVFFGKVLIRKDAQKSNAAQSNKNLLLSDGALADSTPALEIFADDVKAAHGSTIGQLDKDQLFYLRARGLDLPTAKSLLTYAFARDIVGRVQNAAVRDALGQILFTRLPNGNVVREVLNEAEA